MMTNRPRSRATVARSRPTVMAVSETLESRRLLAGPQVVAPPAYPEPGEPPGPDGHLHFEDAPAQQVKVGFNQSVTLAAGAMSLTNLTTGQSVTALTQTHAEPGPTRAWTVDHADPDVWIGSLPRGNYELLFNADKVTNANGEKLDGNRDGTGGDDYVSGFHFQPADANHDRVVDAADYGMVDNFIQFPGSVGFSNGDFNYDAVIDAADYGIIDYWIGTALPPAPSQPNTLTAAAGRGFIDLMWTAPLDTAVDGFHIYRSLDAGDTWTLHHTVADAAARSWRDTGLEGEGLEDGTKYTYRIRAYSDTDGLSMTTNKYWTVTNLPGAAEAPKASLISPDAVTLTWNDNTSNETGFEIEQTGPGGVVTIIPLAGTNNAPTKSHRVTGLSVATGYSFRVRALTAAQASAWSPALNVTTLAVGVPIVPSHVVAHSGSWHSAAIMWDDNSSDETGFTIQRLDAQGVWQTIGTAAANATGYTISSGLTSVTSYTFRVAGAEDFLAVGQDADAVLLLDGRITRSRREQATP